MMDWYGNGGHMTAAGWTFVTLTSVLVFAALVAIAYLIYRAIEHPPGRSDDDPRGLLDERFARGELDIEEYQQRRALLESGRRS